MHDFIDLFAGAGGLSLGFKQAECFSHLAVESHPYSVETFRHNHPSANVYCEDIRKLDPEKMIIDHGLKKGELFALIGGPPCQGFSPSNRKTRNWENPLNHLYKDYLRFLRAAFPQWFVIENVPDFQAFNDGRVVRTVEKYAKWLGYNTQRYVLNAADFGVPQNRKRFLMIGNRTGKQLPDFKDFIKKSVTVQMALEDLPSLKNGNRQDIISYSKTTNLNEYQQSMRSQNPSNNCSGGTVSRSKDFVIERYKRIPPGGNLASLPSEYRGSYKNAKDCHSNIYRRLIPDKMAFTIGNYRKNMMIHPWEDRGLSIREAARLQSFPDHYHFCGPIMSRQKQVGNAVPPLLAEAIAKAIIIAENTVTEEK